MTVGGAAPLSGAQLIINIDAAIAPLLRMLSSQFTDVGNIGGGEDDLMTYSLPANTLNANGRGVRITAWGTTAANANSKTLRIRLGSVNAGAITLSAGVAVNWTVNAVFIRKGSNAQTWLTTITDDQANEIVTTHSSATTETDTSAIILKCTGQATTTNDIIQKGMIVELLA